LLADSLIFPLTYSFDSQADLFSEPARAADFDSDLVNSLTRTFLSLNAFLDASMFGLAG